MEQHWRGHSSCPPAEHARFTRLMLQVKEELVARTVKTRAAPCSPGTEFLVSVVRGSPTGPGLAWGGPVWGGRLLRGARCGESGGQASRSLLRRPRERRAPRLRRGGVARLCIRSPRPSNASDSCYCASPAVPHATALGFLYPPAVFICVPASAAIWLAVLVPILSVVKAEP